MVLHPPVVIDEKRNSLAHGNVFWLPLLCLIKKAHTFFFFEHIKNRRLRSFLFQAVPALRDNHKHFQEAHLHLIQFRLLQDLNAVFKPGEGGPTQVANGINLSEDGVGTI